MNWKLNEDSPIYIQLMEQIKAGIVSGEFPPGERLPSVRELAAEAGVNPNTMQRAFSELERENLVLSQRTAGRFVTTDETTIDQTRRELAGQYIRGFLSAMEALGYSREDSILLLSQTPLERSTYGNSGM